MAYDKKQETEHAFVRLEKDMKKDNLPGLVLLCGSEAYLTGFYRGALVDRYVEEAARAMDLTEITRNELTNQALEEAMETISLLSRRKVVLLPDIIDGRGKLPKNYEEDDKARDELFDILGRIPEGTLVILTAERPITTGDYKKKSDGSRLKKLRTVVKKAGGEVYSFDALNPGQLKAFVVKRFQRAGKDCSREALRRILYDTGYSNDKVEYDLFALENDLKKIIAHSGSGPVVTEEDLEGILTISPEDNVFRMIDGITRGRKDQALIYLNGLLEMGESEFAILAITVKQLEYMLICRELQDEGRPGPQIISFLRKEEKITEGRAKAVSGAAARIPTARVRQMLLSAYAVEERVKSGLMGSRMAMEYMISEA